MPNQDPPPTDDKRNLPLSTDTLVHLRAFVRVQAAHIMQSIVKGSLKNALLPDLSNEELLTFLAELDLAIVHALDLPAVTMAPGFHPYFPRPKHTTKGGLAR